MNLSTLDNINKKVCKALNVDYKEFEKMPFAEQFKLIQKYNEQTSGLKPRVED
jgi:hypothetical protein